MKRILVFGLTTQYGGTESYLLTLYKAIDRTKLQFDFLFEHSSYDIPYEQEILSLGGRIYREYYRNSERNIPGAKTPRQFLSEHPEWDGVYINTQTINTSYRLIMAAKKMRMPYRVIHAHNAGYPKKPSIKDRIYEHFFHLTKRNYVTEYLACSELAGKWAFRSSSFRVICNAVDFNAFVFRAEIREHMRKLYNIGTETRIIGFCGRLCYQKNPQFLIDVFEKIHNKQANTQLLLVGDGELRTDLKQLVAERDLVGSVIFTGEVSNVAEYMQMMDVFVLPSRFEGFGIVLLEAQASGLQCFASENVVPYAVNVGGNVKFLDLERGAEYWANEIVRSEFKRIPCIQKLKDSDYTVEASASQLMKVFEC